MKKVLLLAVLLPALVGAQNVRFYPALGAVVFSEYRATISSAELLALDVTPIVVAIPDADDCAPLPWAYYMDKPAGTAYVVDAGDDLVLETTGGTPYLTVETTGLLDQAGRERLGGRFGSGALADTLFNQNLQLRLLGPITTGTSPMDITIVYHRGCAAS